jgi:hypothetical protein
MRSAATLGLFHALSVSLLLTYGISLVGCDQAGSNSDESDDEVSVIIRASASSSSAKAPSKAVGTLEATFFYDDESCGDITTVDGALPLTKGLNPTETNCDVSGDANGLRITFIRSGSESGSLKLEADRAGESIGTYSSAGEVLSVTDGDVPNGDGDPSTVPDWVGSWDLSESNGGLTDGERSWDIKYSITENAFRRVVVNSPDQRCSATELPIADVSTTGSGNPVLTLQLKDGDGGGFIYAEDDEGTVKVEVLKATDSVLEYDVLQDPSTTAYNAGTTKAKSVSEPVEVNPSIRSDCSKKFADLGKRDEIKGQWSNITDDSGSDLFFDIKRGKTVLHWCFSDNTYGREEVSVKTLRENVDGNIVQSERISEGGGILYDEIKEGGRTVIEYSVFSGQELEWEVLYSAQEDIEGSIANVEPVIGVPTSKEDCKNRSQFIQ